MKIHEYQAKALIADRGIAVPMGHVATTVDEAVAAVRPLIEESGSRRRREVPDPRRADAAKVASKSIPSSGASTWSPKGRGGASGPPRSASARWPSRMLGSARLSRSRPARRANRSTASTSSRASTSRRELYLSVLLDRATSAATSSWPRPKAAPRSRLSPKTHRTRSSARRSIPRSACSPFQARHLAYSLGLDGDAFKNGVRFLDALTSAAVELDTDLVEINPLVVTADGARDGA